MSIGKISKIAIRNVWIHEAHDFTKWLEDNIDVISDVVGFQILNVEREKDAGSFNVDLYGEDESGNSVIIENQLEKSDHDHLGKVMTYLSAFDAKVAIWVTPDPRPEHIRVFEWLNTNQEVTKFFLLKVEAVKIGDSAPAPLFTPVVQPTELAQNVGAVKKEKTRRHEMRYKFWEVVIAETRKETSLFNAISPTEYNWIGAGSGKGGVSFQYWVTQDNLAVKLYIDQGKDSNESNLKIFEALESHKEQIESEFGAAFEWNSMPDNRACIIIAPIIDGGWNTDPSKWEEIGHNAAVTMKKFEQALKPYIAKIKG